MSLSALHDLHALYRDAMGDDATSDTQLDFQDDVMAAWPVLFDDVQYMANMLSTTNDNYTININGGNLFSFRAECAYDIETLRCRLLADRRVFIMDIFPMPLRGPAGEKIDVPDCGAEITIDMTLQELRDFMYLQQDTHVMTQTLRQCPRSKNSFERDYQY